MKALEMHSPKLAQWLSRSTQTTDGPAPRLAENQIGVAYWAAASWGAHIALSKDRPDVVADLPRAIALARLAWEVDPDHGDGALASLMGSFEAARPGGTRKQARVYFDRALSAAAGRSAGPLVTIAESLALADGDRASFESLLRQAIDISAAHPDLGNTVMRERAQWLLDTAPDRF
jgi:predicted anti-sigma-YlaC factor YlaD